MIYPASAVLVIYDPRDHTQRFFDKHDDDVSGMAIHPDGEIVASGQVGHAPVSLFFFIFFFIFFFFLIFFRLVQVTILLLHKHVCVYTQILRYSQHICVLTLFCTNLFDVCLFHTYPPLPSLISRSSSFGEQYHTMMKIQILIYLIHEENLKVNN